LSYNVARMKKLAIGCGIVALLAGAVIVGVGYYGYLKVKGTVTQFAELGKIPDIEREIRVKTPFTAPDNGELTAAQLERFMRVQQHVRERLGANLAAFQANYKELADKKDATIRDVPKLLSAYRDIAAAWLDAKRAQVEALNDANLSLAEYRWIRDAAYQAIGAPFVDIDFGKLAEQAKHGLVDSSPGQLAGAFSGPAPEPNVKLVASYKKQLQDNISLAAFGL
jgi:hypothetical protein